MQIILILRSIRTFAIKNVIAYMRMLFQITVEFYYRHKQGRKKKHSQHYPIITIWRQRHVKHFTQAFYCIESKECLKALWVISDLPVIPIAISALFQKRSSLYFLIFNCGLLCLFCPTSPNGLFRFPESPVWALHNHL